MSESLLNTSENSCQASLMIETPNGSVYLQRLCRHFSRKVKVEWDETKGTVCFPVGICAMQADNRGLRFLCASPDEEKLNVHKGIIERHIDLVTKRETVVVKWQDSF